MTANATVICKKRMLSSSASSKRAQRPTSPALRHGDARAHSSHLQRELSLHRRKRKGGKKSSPRASNPDVVVLRHLILIPKAQLVPVELGTHVAPDPRPETVVHVFSVARHGRVRHATCTQVARDVVQGSRMPGSGVVVAMV